MADARERNQAMEKLLKRGLRKDLDTSGEQCPDANVLAAYFDRELNAEEARRWELHFSSCANCQEQLAALARTEPVAGAKARAAAPGFLGRLWNVRWLAPLATAAAVWALWIAVRPTIPPLEPTVPPEPPAATATRSVAEEPGASHPASKANVPAEPARQGEEGQLARSDRAISATASAGGRSEAAAQAKPEDQFRQNASSELADKRAETDEITATAALAQAPVARDQVEAKREAQEEKAKVAMAQEAEKVPAAAPPPEKPGLKKEQARAAPVPAEAQREVSPGLAAAGPVSRARADSEALRSEDRLASSRDRELRIATPDRSAIWRFVAPNLLENSRDGGRSWAVQRNDLQQPLLAGACPSEKVCWMVGLDGFVLRTTDGENWKQVSAPTEATLVAIEARDADNATVTAADRKRYVTSDGGRTWKPL